MGFVDLGFPLNTLRIKGRAEIHAGPALCAEFEMQGRAAYGYINHRRQRLLSMPKGARAPRIMERGCASPRSELPD